MNQAPRGAMDRPHVLLHGFPPVAGPNIHTLILGSMPGRDSLAAGQYYAHPRNAFWPIMAALFGAQPTLDYDRRKQILVDNGIGLWDVIGSCRRKTSLDSAIEEDSIVVNDLAGFIARHARLHRICFNGGKAEQSFRRYVLPQIQVATFSTIRLPSTSPAHARLAFADKLAAWRAVLSPR